MGRRYDAVFLLLLLLFSSVNKHRLCREGSSLCQYCALSVKRAYVSAKWSSSWLRTKWNQLIIIFYSVTQLCMKTLCASLVCSMRSTVVKFKFESFTVCQPAILFHNKVLIMDTACALNSLGQCEQWKYSIMYTQILGCCGWSISSHLKAFRQTCWWIQSISWVRDCIAFIGDTLQLPFNDQSSVNSIVIDLNCFKRKKIRLGPSNKWFTDNCYRMSMRYVFLNLLSAFLSSWPLIKFFLIRFLSGKSLLTCQ